MTIRTAISRPSGFVPLIMSAVAAGVVLRHLWGFGTPEVHAGRPDEGPEAHVWQLMMAGQLPIVLYFAIRWVRSDPPGTLLVLGVQLLAILAAAAPVFLLHW